MNMRLSFYCFVLTSFFIAGCATPKRVAFTATQCPPDKALVYVYWAGSGTSEDRLAIDVKGEHKALIHAYGYYPLLLAPGSVELGYSAQVNPIYPIRIGKTDALSITLNAGETYYVAYKPWDGWKPKLVLMDNEKGEKEISACTIGKVWQ